MWIKKNGRMDERPVVCSTDRAGMKEKGAREPNATPSFATPLREEEEKKR